MLNVCNRKNQFNVNYYCDKRNLNISSHLGELMKNNITSELSLAIKSGDKTLYIIDELNNSKFYSKSLVDPISGISYEEPSTNSFSFNSPYGWCSSCKGLGVEDKILKEKIIEDDNLSICRGGIAPLGQYRDMWVFKKIDAILKKYNLDISTPIKKIPEDVLDIILFGKNIEVAVESTKYPGTLWHTSYNGVSGFIKKTIRFRSGKAKDFMDDFITKSPCEKCSGQRLKKESLYFKINGTSIKPANETDCPIDDMSIIIIVSELIKNLKSINDMSDIPIE